ncbi:uncharacterized protein SETTUDRAFT_79704, partial [Exserohilum turcica Et28A]
HHTPPTTPPARKIGLTWDDFQYEDDTEALHESPPARAKPPTALDLTISKLHHDRQRFTKTIPNDHKNKLCSPRDRSAVLDIYTEALHKINATNHAQMYTEANAKIRTVLGIHKAGTRDAVFTHQLLRPIEPLYAMPRIEVRHDKHGHRAAVRIQEWRRDGWPAKYPVNAVREEKARKGRFVRWFEEEWEDEVEEEWDE